MGGHAWKLDGLTIYALTDSGDHRPPLLVNWFIAKVEPGQPGVSASEEQLRAIARMMWASPRMLEALEAIANGEGAYGAQAHEYKQIARAAIAAAEPEAEAEADKQTRVILPERPGWDDGSQASIEPEADKP